MSPRLASSRIGTLRVAVLDVGAHRLQRRLGTLRREVGDLWLVGADEIGGGVDDRAAEPLDGVGRTVERRRQPAGSGSRPMHSIDPDDAQAAAVANVILLADTGSAPWPGGSRRRRRLGVGVAAHGDGAVVEAPAGDVVDPASCRWP